MTILLIILAFLLSLSGVVLSLKVKVETSFLNNEFKIRVFLMKIKLYENNNKQPSKKSGKEENAQTEKINILEYISERKEDIKKDVIEIFSYLSKKIHTYKFYVDLKFGVADAADTGKLTGALWSAVGVLFPVFDSLITFDETPVINITPVFNNPCFEFSYVGNYSMRISHILYLAKNIMKKYKKYKGGVKNGSTSN